MRSVFFLTLFLILNPEPNFQQFVSQLRGRKGSWDASVEASWCAQYVWVHAGWPEPLISSRLLKVLTEASQFQKLHTDHCPTPVKFPCLRQAMLLPSMHNPSHCQWESWSSGGFCRPGVTNTPLTQQWCPGCHLIDSEMLVFESYPWDLLSRESSGVDCCSLHSLP